MEEFIRTRDRDRIAIQQAEGIYAGIDLMRQRPTMTPFSEPQHEAKPLNEAAGEIIKEEKEAARTDRALLRKPKQPRQEQHDLRQEGQDQQHHDDRAEERQQRLHQLFHRQAADRHADEQA